MKLVVPLVFAAVAAGVGAPAIAQSKQELVKAELLADVAAVKAGEAFTVGVRLTIEPGWHVYWTNPGDSGAPTTVKLKAPAGFKVGPVQYPVPIRFMQPGDVLGYGYEHEVLLAVRVTPPADLKAGAADVALAADVSWLCCKDACIPGKAKLSLTLPLAAGDADGPPPANREVFDAWSPRMPRADDPAVERVAWDTAGAANGTLIHSVKWKTEVPAKVELYPGRTDAVEFQEVAAKTAGGETRVTIRARLREGPPPESKTLPSLLVYTDAAGQRRGIPVEIPLAKLKPARAN
jgi:DsbC/DsbD-like thiol-disulfide interchange protein